MTAWGLARYAAGLPDPYFAPLAALLGVYPTVARSLREGFQHVGGFLLGAALAIPAGLLLGPGVVGIAVIVLVGVLLGGWRWGDEIGRALEVLGDAAADPHPAVNPCHGPTGLCSTRWRN